MAINIVQHTVSSGPRLIAGDKPVQIVVVGRATGSPGPSTIEEETIRSAETVANAIPHTKPRDIVVIAKKPYHLVVKKLREHPKAHHEFPDTILQLSIEEGNKAVWWSTVDFKITDISYSAHTPRQPDAPRNPFSGLPVTAEDKDDAGRQIWVARSSVPVPQSEGQQYKITLSLEGQEVDPDMYCGK
jgi:hypothetical protein